MAIAMCTQLARSLVTGERGQVVAGNGAGLVVM
jgi:hypothetical protein